MANYKEIQGFPIQNLSSDPVPYAQELADNPYAGVWSSGGAMNSAKRLQGAAGSSSTAGLVFGGRLIPGTNVAETESYDGTSFTEVADLSRTNERAYIAGAGTQTAALAIGGAPPGVLGLTEQWNGSAWTEVADLNRGPAGPQSTTYGAGSGSSTSALYSSSDEGGNLNDRVESWDGSSWTEVSEVNTARSYGTQAGTDNTSAILAGGYSTTNAANVETWDGSSWSEITDINTARMRLSSGMQGSTESMLIFSGYTTDSVANTEDWDGSSWTEVNDLATARRSGAGSGTALNSFFSGGQTGPSAPSVVASTEEWTFSGLPPSTPAAGYSDAIIGQMYYNSTTGQFKAIKTGSGSWSSGGSLNTARRLVGRSGITTSGLAFGGSSSPPAVTGVTESYDGTSYTEVADLNTARYLAAGGFGESNTAALAPTGSTSTPGTGMPGAVEQWDGSSWTEVGSRNSNTSQHGAGGTSTSGMAFGGFGPPPSFSHTGAAETWNGSAWTEVSDLNTARRTVGTGSGTVTAMLAMGGSGPTGKTESWDGSSWTEVSDLNTARGQATGFGIYTAALLAGGSSDPPVRAFTEEWDGSSWTEVGDLATARGQSAGGGSTTSGFISGGNTPSITGNTEEWAVADFEINTLTTS